MNVLPYADDSLDCLLAYHVISHTDSIGIKGIVEEIKRVLRPNGEYYITLCSKNAWSYKDAGFRRLDENTVVKEEDGPENGIPHYFVDEAGIGELLKGTRIVSMQHIQDLVVDGKPYGSWHYFILGVNEEA